MELSQIAKKVFGFEYFEASTSRILCMDNKKIFLLEAREWMQEYLNDLARPSNPDLSTKTSTQTTRSAEPNESDTRRGRIGGSNVYFTLDRSFGIVAINQEGLNVIAACRFASVTASVGVYEGKWMYELHLGSKGIMQIGWCSNLCGFTIDRGCGDTQNSYAFDGSRIRSWNMLSHEYGELWKTGDIIGICIDLDDKTIEFYRNGRSLGIAYSNIAVGAGIIYLPCVSLVEGESVYANFGARPFRYPNQKYEPLQQIPHVKVSQIEIVLKWLRNLTCIVVPVVPSILNCYSAGDISDSLFWNRMYSSLCYYLNTYIMDRYCLFNNFIPFIGEICDFKDGRDYKCLQPDNFYKILDEMWLYVKERNLEKCLYQIFNSHINNFKQVSETLNCPKKNRILNTIWVLLSHETTRKYVIKHLMFERIDIFAFMHHKPLDEKYFNEIIGDSWWDTKGVISSIEKQKRKFRYSFHKIEKAYDQLENQQCGIIRVLLTNDDGNETEPSSRMMFLKKFRKFCWHELECARNELNSKLPSSIAYASFARMTKTLDEIWYEENDDLLIFPVTNFYDQTFRYTNCDRIGGLEQFLLHTLHDELAAELGENHEVFLRESSRNMSTIPLQDLRQIGLSEAVNILESNESVVENFIMPTTSSGPFYQALFAPFFREQQEDLQPGNGDRRNSLLELYEDLLMFFMSAVSKHCKKISRVQSNLEQCANEYNVSYLNYKKLKYIRPEIDPVLKNLKLTMELQEDDLQKRAKKSAWINYVLLNSNRYQHIVKMFEILIVTISNIEKKGELFVFLPDFYFDACDILTEVFIKDFNSKMRSCNHNGEIRVLLTQTAELMINLVGDKRIKHIDCKKVPINILSTFATNQEGMQILESVDAEKSALLISKLMVSYADRYWKASNWILVRFWHGSGFGFKYASLPHHSSNMQQCITQMNYAMYNIAACPSPKYQHLVREKLLDSNTAIPALLDSIISELHWTFGEFLTPMQELQRAIERNEQLLMMGRLYKMCSTYFDKTIGLLRVLDMFIATTPEVFLESYYPESTAFTRRIIQVVLLIIHRISSKQGCFRTVMNSRIAVLENVEYFPIEAACISILLDILGPEMEHYSDDDLSIPLYCRMVLTDPSYDFDNLQNLIGSPEAKNNAVVSLHDYDGDVMSTEELQKARNMLRMLQVFQPKLSNVKVIPEDALCTICYSVAYDVRFYPCGHFSCLACISYYLTKNRLCFFCKRHIIKVINIADDEVIASLTDREAEMTETE